VRGRDYASRMGKAKKVHIVVAGLVLGGDFLRVSALGGQAQDIYGNHKLHDREPDCEGLLHFLVLYMEFGKSAIWE